HDWVRRERCSGGTSLLWFGRHLQHSPAGACEEVARAQSREYRKASARRDRCRQYRLHDADRCGHGDPGRPHRRADRLGDRRPRTRGAHGGGWPTRWARPPRWRCDSGVVESKNLSRNDREAIMAKKAKKAKSKTKKTKKKAAPARKKKKGVVAKKSKKKAAKKKAAPKKAAPRNPMPAAASP